MLGAVVQARVWERELELVAQVVTRPFRCVLEVQSVEWHGEERVCAQREAQDQPVHACPPFGRSGPSLHTSHRTYRDLATERLFTVVSRPHKAIHARAVTCY